MTDLRQALAYVTTLNSTPGTLLTGKLDLSRVASAGLRPGAARDQRGRGQDIRTYVALASTLAAPPPPRPAISCGTADKDVAQPGRRPPLDAKLPSPSASYWSSGPGHNVSTTCCTIGGRRAVLVAFVKQLISSCRPASWPAPPTAATMPDGLPTRPGSLIDQAVTDEQRGGASSSRTVSAPGSDASGPATGSVRLASAVARARRGRGDSGSRRLTARSCGVLDDPGHHDVVGLGHRARSRTAAAGRTRSSAAPPGPRCGRPAARPGAAPCRCRSTRRPP